MRAVTLWRPWDQAMAHGGKPVENRPWAFWPAMIGQPMALHAGKRYDKEGAAWMRDEGLYVPPSDQDSPTGIVAVVTFSRVIHELQTEDDPILDSPWFFGPFGWVVGEMVPLASVVPCKGAQGIWTLPPDVEQAVRSVLTAMMNPSENLIKTTGER